MRKHMIVKQRSRDSALYAVTNSEWEVLRPQLAAKAKLKGEGQSQGQDRNSNKKGLLFEYVPQGGETWPVKRYVSGFRIEIVAYLFERLPRLTEELPG